MRETAINDLGQVVGLSETAAGLWIDHAFFYDGTVMHDLGTLGGYTSRAEDVNNSGIIVGQSDAGSSGWRAFVYDGHAMYDPNDLIDPDSGWTLLDAAGINDYGQIVGVGENALGQSRAFLLTPVPEPSSVLSLLCGIGGIGLLIRRRRPKIT